ncbi:hypothetical protein [Caulobacter sp. UNC279MFTsu5.1]|uniref:hypothetical protein n=1 Tax=Caulobacter sp. UNC279MFTsu5.1 TaxID=1502775 RepID=UPI000B1D6FC2|nr:hypothetical protein [Caulobacter sp. UNC279MFTsu5.1]
MGEERRRKRDEFLGEVVGGGAEVGVEAGFAALAEAPPVAIIVGAVAGLSVLGFLAWKTFAHYDGKKIRG